MKNGKTARTSTGPSGSTSRKDSALATLFVIFIALSSPAHARTFETHPPLPVPPLVYDDAEGQQHALSDFRGRFVLVNLWATWCSPCVSEMPLLDALQTHFGPELVVLPLAQSQTDMTVKAFYQTHKIQHLPVAIDKTGRASFSLGIRGLPTTILIDPNGQEVAKLEGDIRWDSDEIHAFLRQEMSR